MTRQGTTVQPRPKLWYRLSVPAGNVLQLAGLLAGTGLLYLAAQLRAVALQVALMLLGWLAIYVCCHAIAHYVLGRLVGIQFRGYGIRGTDHPRDYPPGIRQLMSALPMFTALTQPASLRQARPVAKALMFSAGETSTAICSLLAGWYAWQSGIPGGQSLFYTMVVFNLISTIVTAIVPRGDYTKARRALRGAAS